MTGLLGDAASSFYVSRSKDSVDQVSSLNLVTLYGGGIYAPTEIPALVPGVAPACQEPAGYVLSPPRKRCKESTGKPSVGGYLSFGKRGVNCILGDPLMYIF